jgi:hypothetical protein
VHTVLGFATTQTAIDFVRIDGSGTASATLTRESLRAEPVGGDAAGDAYTRLVARIWFRMRRAGHADEYPVRSVGVTWTEGADHEASLLVEALTAAGLDNVVAVDVEAASKELTRLDESPPVTPLAAQEAQMALALGAALASAHSGGPLEEPAERRALRPRARTKAGLLAAVLAVMLLLTLTSTSALRHTSNEPSQPAQPPRVDTTLGGAVVVPASSTPVPGVQAPLIVPPSAPAPDNGGGPISPPAGVRSQPPASAPTPEPLGPAPPPPPIPDSPPIEQAPSEPNCVLLCGITI